MAPFRVRVLTWALEASNCQSAGRGHFAHFQNTVEAKPCNLQARVIKCAQIRVLGDRFIWELELELILSHMTQKPVLRGEVGARALRVRSDGSLYLGASTYVASRSISAPMPLLALAGGGGTSGVPPKGDMVDLNRCMGPVTLKKDSNL